MAARSQAGAEPAPRTRLDMVLDDLEEEGRAASEFDGLTINALERRLANYDNMLGGKVLDKGVKDHTRIKIARDKVATTLEMKLRNKRLNQQSASWSANCEQLGWKQALEQVREIPVVA